MRYWTAGELTRIATFLQDGLNAREIAQNFPGRSRASVLGIVNRDPTLRRISFKKIIRPDRPKDEAGETSRKRKISETIKVSSAIRQAAGRVSSSDIEARLAEIPQDTRSFTARTFGDPLPGRSALDRRSQAHGV